MVVLVAAKASRSRSRYALAAVSSALVLASTLGVLLTTRVGDGGGSTGGTPGGGGWVTSLGRVAACPACPSCPHRGQAGSGDEQEESGVPLLCEGSVPPLQETLAAATAALEDGPAKDLARWKERGGFTRGDLEATARRTGINGNNDIHEWVEIKDNRVYFPRRKVKTRCEGICNYMFGTLVNGLNKGLELGKLKLKEGVPMLWNVYDEGLCWDEGGRVGCPAPIFSVIRHATRNYDLLMPVFTEKTTPIYVPWREKREIAWFRGTPFFEIHPLNGTWPDEEAAARLTASHRANCSRAVLSLLTPDHPDLINATLSESVPEEKIKGVPGRGLTYPEQAEFKYIIGLDGYTASRRLAAILGTNSAVLKQTSLQWEWYYRALQPCQHYLPFWIDNTTDILQLVQALKGSQANDDVAQAIAANAQAFAIAHLIEEARWRYWQALFDAYAELYLGGNPDDPPSNNQTVLMSWCWRCEMVDAEKGEPLPADEQDRLRRGPNGNGPLDRPSPAAAQQQAGRRRRRLSSGEAGGSSSGSSGRGGEAVRLQRREEPEGG